MIVVSNTSPIINLATIGQLDLLRQLYGRVVIPQAVYDEIVETGAQQPGAVQVRTSDWIETRQVSDRRLAAELEAEVDKGEAQAIVLAKELQADLLLIDERKGRRVAGRFGIRVVGLLGVLVVAKQRGHVAAVKPVLDALISQAGFWIGKSLYDQVLETMGE